MTVSDPAKGQSADKGRGAAAKRIAVFDYRVSLNNPIGGCQRQILAALCTEYDFTVFAVEFDNPSAERIAYRRVVVPRRPLALLFVAYHLVAPLCYWSHRLRNGKRFDAIQMVESNLSFGTIAVSQFCHRAYLRRQIARLAQGRVRQVLRWLNHRLHAQLEPWVYRRVEHIVVPSRGIAKELAHEYPNLLGKIRVIPNPVRTESLRRPDNFDHHGLRRELGWNSNDLVIVFVALGHYERKGLPILLEALQCVSDPRLGLLVVGGEGGLVRSYEARVRRLRLEGRVVFTGSCRDVRPYLWSADAFVFPSHYETFSLVAVEAAASGLPVIAPLLHGVEEWLRDGENGLVITQTAESVATALTSLLNRSRAELEAMGARAARDVRCFNVDDYATRWRQFYDDMAKKRDGHLA